AEPSVERVEVLGEIAALQARAGDLAAAVETVAAMREIVDSHLDLAGAGGWLCDLARAQAATGQRQQALATLDRAEARGRAYSGMAWDFDRMRLIPTRTDLGDVSGALRLAAEARGPHGKSVGPESIVPQRAERGDVAGALKLVDRIQSPHYGATALRLVGEAQARTGDRAAARTSLERAKQAAAAASGQTRSDALVEVAQGQATVGAVPDALK